MAHVVSILLEKKEEFQLTDIHLELLLPFIIFIHFIRGSMMKDGMFEAKRRLILMTSLFLVMRYGG